jgi:HSP20 family molecular chaperone IbpA
MISSASEPFSDCEDHVRDDEPAGDWMWSEACALIERAERLQRDLCWPGMVGAQEVGREPPVDVYEDRHQMWVVAALPGVEQSDLDVAVESGVLVVSGFRRAVLNGASELLRGCPKSTDGSW